MARLAASSRQSSSSSYVPTYSSPTYGTVTRRLSKPIAAIKLGLTGAVAGAVVGLLVLGTVVLAGWLMSASFSGTLAGVCGGVTVGICLGSVLGLTGEKAGLRKFVFSQILFGLSLAAIGAFHAVVGDWYGWPVGGSLVMGIMGIVLGAILGE